MIKKSSTEVCWDKDYFSPLHLNIPPSMYSSTSVTLKLLQSSPQALVWDPKLCLWISTILWSVTTSACWFDNLKISLALRIHICVIGLGWFVWGQVTMCGFIYKSGDDKPKLIFLFTVFQHYEYYILLIFLVEY